MKLFLGNLPYDTTDSELQNLFSQYGDVVNINLIKDQYSGKSKGFAFVEMATRAEGQKAMETLNNMRFKNKDLVCNEAIHKKKGKRRR
mgnify:CR=1 FL=1